jgi:hypothetical protein
LVESGGRRGTALKSRQPAKPGGLSFELSKRDTQLVVAEIHLDVVQGCVESTAQNDKIGARVTEHVLPVIVEVGNMLPDFSSLMVSLLAG